MNSVREDEPLRTTAAGEAAAREWQWSTGEPESPAGSAIAGCVEYIGRTALVVTGPYTGARYRFDQPGARLSVDARDRQAMLSIPMLRAVIG